MVVIVIVALIAVLGIGGVVLANSGYLRYDKLPYRAFLILPLKK